MDEMLIDLLAVDEPPPVTVYNDTGTSPLLIVADHAGNLMPRSLNRLGVRKPNADVTLPGTSASPGSAAIWRARSAPL